MALSILIATLGTRHIPFVGLMDKLLAQADEFPGEIEILAYWNNGELSIGQIRQALLEEAKGDYICFIDDDDDVPDYYCREIMANLGTDYVGFMLEYWHDGVLKPTSYHSIKYQTWHQDGEGYYRNVTHLNPIRRSIALQGDFASRSGAGEDESWATQVAPLVKTEKYIDRHMYIYNHNSDTSSFGGIPNTGEPKRAPITHPCFRYIRSNNENDHKLP